jgi:hypothetical protein
VGKQKKKKSNLASIPAWGCPRAAAKQNMITLARSAVLISRLKNNIG